MHEARPSAIPIDALLALMLATFSVSAGYGVVLPVLPDSVAALGGAATGEAFVSRHTGLLAGAYTLALFVLAPLWGRLSDRYGRRPILMIGLVGYVAATLLLALGGSLALFYAERLLSGAFSASVTPVASAAVGELVKDDTMRARRLTLLSIASVAGFVLGPMLGVFSGSLANGVLGLSGAAAALLAPRAAVAVLALLAATAVALRLPRTATGRAESGSLEAARGAASSIRVLLALGFIAAAAVGVFEVGLALRGRRELGLSPYQIATMFMECSLVMLVAQALVFSPRVKPAHTRWLIAPATIMLGGGLLLVPMAWNFTGLLIAVGVVAASAGVLSPILTYWISTLAGGAQGAQLGRQTAAASLGQTTGSAVGGLLFNISLLPGAPFVLTAALTAFGFFLSVGLPARLYAVARVAPVAGTISEPP